MNQQRNSFTFRHVVNACGIPPSNEVHWAVGQQIQRIAARRGIEPERLLTEKTDPNPSVAAPHCIAHYPMTLFAEVCQEIRDWWGDRERQGDLFESFLGREKEPA